MTLCPKSELFSEDVSIVALGDLVENLAQEEAPYEFAYERIGHPWPFWSLIPTRFLARARRELILVQVSVPVLSQRDILGGGRVERYFSATLLCQFFLSIQNKVYIRGIAFSMRIYN